MTFPVLQQIEVFHGFSEGKIRRKETVFGQNSPELLRTLKRESIDRTRLLARPSSWQLPAKKKSSHRIFYWILASKFLAFSSIFLRDPAQTSQPKIYQKKHRVIFDIKVSATRLILLQEKLFP